MNEGSVTLLRWYPGRVATLSPQIVRWPSLYVTVHTWGDHACEPLRPDQQRSYAVAGREWPSASLDGIGRGAGEQRSRMASSSTLGFGRYQVLRDFLMNFHVLLSVW
jgi:hypothetical protein